MIQIAPVRPEALGIKNYQKTDVENVFISSEDQTVYLLDGDKGIEIQMGSKNEEVASNISLSEIEI